jgi:hypothetical protein
MKPRWLLLAVSVMCLLVLFPASALSQSRVEAGCGSADVDGILSEGEWQNAVRVPWAAPVEEDAAGASSAQAHGDAQPSQAGLSGWLYLLNDLDKLYLAAFLDLGGMTVDPGWWGSEMTFEFTDEGNALDDRLDAANCSPAPGEGHYVASRDTYFGRRSLTFEDYSRTGFCFQEVDPPGVAFAVAPGSLVWEWEVDLSTSELDKVDPGDCFRFGATAFLDACELDSGCDYGGVGNWDHGHGVWPEGLQTEQVATYGTVCLNDCVVEEEFVPEPGTLMLLGSGLAGLAGYATLRWRTRE